MEIIVPALWLAFGIIIYLVIEIIIIRIYTKLIAVLGINILDPVLKIIKFFREVFRRAKVVEKH